MGKSSLSQKLITRTTAQGEARRAKSVISLLYSSREPQRA